MTLLVYDIIKKWRELTKNDLNEGHWVVGWAFNSKARYMPRVHWILTCVRQLCGPAAAKYAQLPLNGQTFEHRLLLLAQRGESHPIVIQLFDASVAGRIENPKMGIFRVSRQRDLWPSHKDYARLQQTDGGWEVILLKLIDRARLQPVELDKHLRDNYEMFLNHVALQFHPKVDRDGK